MAPHRATRRNDQWPRTSISVAPTSANTQFRESGLQVLFGLLTVSAQWELHDYYQTDQHLDEMEFLALRKQADLASPSLVSRLGKHFRVIERAFVTVSRQHGMSETDIRLAVAAAIRESDVGDRIRADQHPKSSGVQIVGE